MWPFSSRATDTMEPESHGRRTPPEGRDNDPTLAQKKRARRRLIGAFTLALTAIVVVPMVFDSQPNPHPEEIVIKIPDQDSLGKPLPGARDIPAEPSAPAVLLDAPQPEAKSEGNAPVSSGTAEKPAPAAKAETSVKSASADSAKSSEESKRAQAALQGKSEVKTDDRYVVQVGAYSSAEKVKQLQDKLNLAGIKSFTQKVNAGKGEMIRLRVGPFAEHAEAEAAEKKIKAAGLSGTVMPAK